LSNDHTHRKRLKRFSGKPVFCRAQGFAGVTRVQGSQRTAHWNSVVMRDALVFVMFCFIRVKPAAEHSKSRMSLNSGAQVSKGRDGGLTGTFLKKKIIFNHMHHLAVPMAG